MITQQMIEAAEKSEAGVLLLCGCSLSGPYERQCDYCGYLWEDKFCPHSSVQEPCPECSVVPIAQS